ncbi:unnamed protein product [Adineta steineri]|uniref:Uncharacterized protein n=1 Tax=Adineta steineri TaxID=433720 RepID=A0A820NV61_9BILA|nr:unnamed protein product [Adineta steineri]
MVSQTLTTKQILSLLEGNRNLCEISAEYPSYNNIQSLFSGPKVPVNQFLNRLPKTVIKNGQVIDVRQDIEQHLVVSNK